MRRYSRKCKDRVKLPKVVVKYIALKTKWKRANYLTDWIDLKRVHTNLGIEHFKLAITRVNDEHDSVN